MTKKGLYVNVSNGTIPEDTIERIVVDKHLLNNIAYEPAPFCVKSKHDDGEDDGQELLIASAVQSLV